MAHLFRLTNKGIRGKKGRPLSEQRKKKKKCRHRGSTSEGSKRAIVVLSFALAVLTALELGVLPAAPVFRRKKRRLAWRNISCFVFFFRKEMPLASQCPNWLLWMAFKLALQRGIVLQGFVEPRSVIEGGHA